MRPLRVIRKLLKCKSGFTLVELIVATILLLMIVTVSQGFLFEAIISWQKGSDRLEVNDNLRISLDRMSRELRTADNLLGNDSHKLEFNNSDEEEVEYYVTINNELIRYLVDDSKYDILATGVNKLDLIYYDKDNDTSKERVAITIGAIVGDQSKEVTTSIVLQGID